MTAIEFNYHDGGRADSGYIGEAKDCVVRAIAIAAELPYEQVKIDLTQRQADYAKNHRDRHAKKIQKRNDVMHAGVHKPVYASYIESLGFRWVSTMSVGSGCTVRLTTKDLPTGRLICRLSKHLCSVIDNVLYDTHDCSRMGRRCVYGYWIKV